MVEYWASCTGTDCVVTPPTKWKLLQLWWGRGLLYTNLLSADTMGSPDVVKSHGAYSKRESTDYPDQMRWIRGNSAEWLIHIPEIDLYFLLVYLSHNNFLEHVSPCSLLMVSGSPDQAFERIPKRERKV